MYEAVFSRKFGLSEKRVSENEQLLKEARDLYNSGDYLEALETVSRILEADG